MKKPELNCKPDVPFIPGTVGTEKINNTDPYGSYTGRAADNEIPVQDADDL